jgi:hypothetical protein
VHDLGHPHYPFRPGLYDPISKEASVNWYILLVAAFFFLAPIELNRRLVYAEMPQNHRRRLIWSCSVLQVIGLLTFLAACVTG